MHNTCHSFSRSDFFKIIPTQEEWLIDASHFQVLYAAKGAVEKAGEGDAAPIFAEDLKKIEFSNDQQKKEAMNAAFVSVCSTGIKKEVDLLLAQVSLRSIGCWPLALWL